MLAAWLNLSGGVSRTTTGIMLKAIATILATAFHIISITLLKALGHDIDIPIPNIPRDVRSTYNTLNIEPTIIHTICCPKCFTLYPLHAGLPDRCTWKQSPRAHACREPLMMHRRTKKGKVPIPRRMYSTQCFKSWLEFFLQRPGIEEAINKSYLPSVFPDGKVRDTWGSKAWRKLAGFPQQPGNLTFSLYVDWFNPFTNKITGKVVSTGAILLCCMNLPPDIRYLPENVFIVGITPGPNLPDVITISHILRPLIDTLI
ncbi:hypothetical protein K435DRAFT_879290 [Dendrothele bispora CBS 962.96]|uniref:Uncharacterized protein n=1 Tax=Dendrothele bispora (strain CBS 962.96) TaxID=1314807 RepID=A0A4S8KLI9_DENBC|nr:hypothetical protein K435DRAFT_879290 [Dendrothele bispora CBS 962.96]